VPVGTCVRVLLPLGTCVRVLLPVGTCVTVFLTTGEIGLVDFTTLRVVEVGREKLFVVGRETLRTTGLVCTTVRAGAVLTGATFFFCSAVRVVVEPASFDAGAVCAIARDDVCTAAATAKAAIKMISLRMCAPFFFFRFPPDPLRERERQNVMDARERLYRFYSLNMTCIKLALLPHPLWIGCESQIGAVFAFSMAKWNRATRMWVRRTNRRAR
jgi:hypothetical protein